MGTYLFSDLYPAKYVAFLDYLFKLFLNILSLKKKKKKPSFHVKLRLHLNSFQKPELYWIMIIRKLCA